MAETTYTVKRTALVEAPPERVFEQVVDFHRWPAWSPWEGLDPQMQREYSGAERGAGSAYAWSGNRKAGRGRMTMTEAADPSSVVIDLVFEKPFKSSSTTSLRIHPEGAGSRVTWSMTGTNTLMTKVLGVFTSMDNLVGKDFEKGLAQLKAVAEPAG